MDHLDPLSGETAGHALVGIAILDTMSAGNRPNHVSTDAVIAVEVAVSLAETFFRGLSVAGAVGALQTVLKPSTTADAGLRHKHEVLRQQLHDKFCHYLNFHAPETLKPSVDEVMDRLRCQASACITVPKP